MAVKPKLAKSVTLLQFKVSQSSADRRIRLWFTRLFRDFTNHVASCPVIAGVHSFSSVSFKNDRCPARPVEGKYIPISDNYVNCLIMEHLSKIKYPI